MTNVQKKRVNKKDLLAPALAKRKTPITFSIDIGGSGIKATLLNGDGALMKKRLRIPTPDGAKPEIIIKQLEQLSKQLGKFDRIAVGFPGVVRNGVTRVAPNLAVEWKGYDFAKALTEKFSKPVRVMNDADMQGFGVISGKGVELVLTLGTGVGTALFVHGTLVPNVEAGADRVDSRALNKIGRKRWNRRLAKYIRKLEASFNYDRLFIGGGNSKYVDIQNLSGNVTICSNLNGLLGGVHVWGH
jgi:polyphosphate glucokinase